MSFPRYERYKDSGVDWLGEVPEHWQMHTLKHVVSTPITDGPHETPEFLHEGVPFVSAEAVSSGTLDFGKMRGFISREDHERYGEKYLPRRNDIFMVKSGATTGVTALVDTDVEFNIWSPLAAIRCGLNADPYFMLFYLRSKNFIEAVTLNWSFGTQQNIGMGVIENLCIPLPCIEEQEQIATFLKCEIGKIDDLIEEQRRLVELLNEKRKAVISHGVTKGLDHSVPMKASGVDWIGLIPQEWEIAKLGQMANVVRGGSPRPAGDTRFFNGDFIPWITVGEVTKDDGMYLVATESMLTQEGAALSRTIDSGTLVLTNSGATLGVPKILGITGCANDGILAFLDLNANANKKYLYFVLGSLTSELRERMKQGSGQPNLNTGIVGALTVPLPPVVEQLAIVTELERMQDEFGALMEQAGTSVTLLQERRSALMSAAVTGKIDVRNYTPKEAA